MQYSCSLLWLLLLVLQIQLAWLLLLLLLCLLQWWVCERQ